jgi:hypothetical protein
LALISILYCPNNIESFAFWMENDFCDRSVKPGAVIMNQAVVLAGDAGRIRVFRRGIEGSFEEELLSDDFYRSGEEVRVWLSLHDDALPLGAGSEAIFEVQGAGARFPGGLRGAAHCRGRVRAGSAGGSRRVLR